MVLKIRANSVLAARREAITLTTADGHDLVAEIARPLDREPVATIICLHPLPTHGGMMDSHILRKASFRLPELAGIAVLRFNTRGTWSEQGTSDGAFDNAVGERFDVAAAIEWAEFEDLLEDRVDVGSRSGRGHGRSVAEAPEGRTRHPCRISPAAAMEDRVQAG